MPNREFDCSFLSGEEIAMLRQLHADVCAEKTIPPGTEAADLMALKIMTMFIAGVTDVHALRSEVMKSKAA